jgi:hypothetical protein
MYYRWVRLYEVIQYLTDLWHMHVAGRPNLFFCNSIIYFLINAVPFKVVSLGLYSSPSYHTTIQSILCSALLETWFCLNCGDVIKFPFLYFQLEFQGKKSDDVTLSLLVGEGMEWYFVFSHKSRQNQNSVSRCVPILEKPINLMIPHFSSFVLRIFLTC